MWTTCDEEPAVSVNGGVPWAWAAPAPSEMESRKIRSGVGVVIGKMGAIGTIGEPERR